METSEKHARVFLTLICGGIVWFVLQTSDGGVIDVRGTASATFNANLVMTSNSASARGGAVHVDGKVAAVGATLDTRGLWQRNKGVNYCNTRLCSV